MGRLQKITVPSHLFLLGAAVLLKLLFQSSTDLRLIRFHQKFQYVISGLFLCIRIVEAEIQHVFFAIGQLPPILLAFHPLVHPYEKGHENSPPVISSTEIVSRPHILLSFFLPR